MSDGGVDVRPLRLSEVGPFVAHLARQMGESGRDGAPHSGPRTVIDRDDTRARIERDARVPLGEPGWERAWLAWVGERDDPRRSERVIGHVDLRGGRLAAEMHRAVLGMGVERSHWRRGLGERLLRTALGWARDETDLAWVDLFVFAENAPARALYRKLGFEERGTVEDAFRLDDGTRVADVRMVLKLR